MLWSCWKAVLVNFLLLRCTEAEADVNGYVVYCPCMGRFGNQADHFLGSLAFSKAINRTLILPPWVEYQRGNPRSVQVPFDKYFKVEPILRYHSVITMDNFMSNLADKVWPKGNRMAFCYGPREGAQQDDCNAKEGNPFGPFWDTFNIDFDGSVFYGGNLPYDSSVNGLADIWKKRYPPSSYPVLAFAGAPATFPVSERDRHLHKYLEWSTSIDNEAEKFISTVLPDGPFIGVHLRNDLDWDNVCGYVDSNTHLFASPQCLGYHFEQGRLTREICQPSKQTITNEIYAAVKRVKAKSVFIASDRDHMIQEINQALKPLGVSAYKRSPDQPHVSLAILGRSTLFIGNCVSSFSAFVKRERDSNGFKLKFFGFETAQSVKRDKQDL